MSYTLINLPPSVSAKPLEVKQIFIKSYEDALTRGFSKIDAEFTANQHAKVKDRLLNLSKSKDQSTNEIQGKPKVPMHLAAILNNQNKEQDVQKQSTARGSFESTDTSASGYYRGVPNEVFDRVLKGKGELTPNASRSLVSAKWDKQGRLELNFDDGNKLLTDPVPMIGTLEQHLHIPNSQSTAEDDNTMLSKRIDFISDNVIYKAEAPVGTLNTTPLWRIRLITISVTGDTVETWAGGTDNFDKVWDNRLSYTYS